MFNDEVTAICSQCGDLLAYANELCITTIEETKCENCGAKDWDIEFD